MEFEVIGEITDVETIARGVSVRQRRRLTQRFGRARWRKMKGHAMVALGTTRRHRQAELHWYEGHGVGPREYKIKRFLD